MSLTYEQSGVSIDAGNEAVKRIRPLVNRTHNAGVLNGIGGFGGFFAMPTGMREPVMVSCTDGVGTKLRLAIDLGILDTVGIDLVAMNVNDLICAGAKPLFFLDYIACHQLIPDQIEAIIKGITDGCLESNCALIGGEMAEMNDMYKPNDFDLAGFCVGVVERSEIIDGSNIRPGDKLYGFPSSGVHSNGYSLVRKILQTEMGQQIDKKTLLTPTRIYVKDIARLQKLKHPINGIAHITGGGLHENVSRILPKGLSIALDYDAIQVPELFVQLQKAGNVEAEEMWRVFNMGIGLVVISPEAPPASTGAIEIGKVVP